MRSPSAAGIVVTACSLAACRTTAPEPKPADGASPATVVVPATPAQPSASSSAAAAPARPGPPDFLRTAAWQHFRDQWRALDAVQSPAVSPSSPFPTPTSTGPHVQEAGRLALEALDKLEKEPSSEGLDPATLRAFRSIVSTRVAVLTGLETRLMVMHRLPSPGELATARVGASLERRIDALIELRKRGALSVDESRAALDSILGRIHLLVALQSSLGYSMENPFGSAETLDDLEKSLKTRRRDSADAGAEDVLDGLQKGIALAREIAPLLEAMIADLER